MHNVVVVFKDFKTKIVPHRKMEDTIIYNKINIFHKKAKLDLVVAYQF